jgi:hypothetical protein
MGFDRVHADLFIPKKDILSELSQLPFRIIINDLLDLSF